MKNIGIISVGIVCVVLVGLAVAAGPGTGGWHRSPEEKIEFLKSKITDKLELDDTQRETLDRIADDIIAEHEELSSTRGAFKANFVEMLAKESVSPEELKVLFETKKPVIEDMMQFASVHIAEFHSVLTPEQRATLIEEIKSHKGHRCRFTN